MMKNKRAESESQKASSNSAQTNQTTDKTKQQKRCIPNQKMTDDAILNKQQLTHDSAESKYEENVNHKIHLKNCNSDNNRDNNNQNLSLILQDKNDMSFEVQITKDKNETTFLDNKNESIQKKSDQIKENQRNPNQPPKQKQVRTLQLQRIHNRNLQQEKANESLRNQQTESQQQKQRSKQCCNTSQSQNQSIHQQVSTDKIHPQEKAKPLQHQDQQQSTIPHQQTKNKPQIQSIAHTSNQQHSPPSKASQQFNYEPRKSSSLVSKERPFLLKDKSQNVTSKDHSDKNQPNSNDTRRKKKGTESCSDISSKPLKHAKLEFSKSTSIVYYIDNPQPPKISGNIIALLDDQVKLSFKKKHLKRKRNENVNQNKINESNEEELKTKLIGRPPIPQFLGTNVTSEEEEEEEEEDYINDQVNPNDLMNNYWPNKCESKRTFEEEFNFNDSMRVCSIRNFSDVISNCSPQHVTDMEKIYMVAPPSPLSPLHAFNPRKFRRHQLNRVINHVGTPSKSNEKVQNLKIITPKREKFNDEENIEQENEELEYVDYSKEIDVDDLIDIENNYEFNYECESEAESESESKSESESEDEAENETENNEIKIKINNDKNENKIKDQNNENDKNEDKIKTEDENKTKVQNNDDQNDENKIKVENDKNEDKIKTENENKTKDQNDDNENDKVNNNDENKIKDEDESNADNKIEKEKDNKKQEKDPKTENIFMNTNKNLSQELRNYEKLINKMDNEDIFEMISFIENELKGFNNMTSIKGPFYEEEMTVVRFKNMNCEVIEMIHPKAFEEFRFGNCVYYNDDISPDELHISAWHSLGIDPDYISVCLDRFVKNNILGKNDISNIYGVLRYILRWIQLYPDDFFINPDCAVHTCKVLNRVIDKRIEVSSRSNVLKALIRAISQRKKSYAAVQFPLPTFHPEEFHKYQRISIYDKIFKFEKDIDILVQHFTFIDISLIRKILRSEIIQLNFLKDDKKISAPHVQDITTRFNIMARFVSYSILSVVRNHSSKLEKKCKSRIEFWILVMKRAREIRNFNLLYEIDGGLSHPSISRLTNVWKSISKSLKDDFNKLHDITKPLSENMKEYINLVLEDPENTVPYLGTFFSRIVYSCEFYHKKDKMLIPQDKLNDDLKDGNNEVTGYNMVYQYYLFKECSKIFLNWGSNYKFKLDINILKVLKDISFSCDNKRLSEFSVQIQPKALLK